MDNQKKQDIINTINTLINEYGSQHIKASQVMQNLGKSAKEILVTYGTLISAGVYTLESFNEDDIIVDDEIASIINPTETVEIEGIPKTTDYFHNECLIPPVNEYYVEFGCYAPVLRIVKSNSFLPFFIQGESGNGKTEGVEQACAVAKRELVCCNVTNETTEEDLMGSFILSNGNMIWKDGPVLVAMRRGAVLLIDESDQFGTSCMALQSVLQCKPYYVKKTNEMVYPKKGFTIIATANTKGDGDAGDRFVGANVLNEAFLERFNCVFEQQYPPAKVEMKILSKICDDNVFLVNIVRWASSIRENYRLGTISRCITTRRLVQIVKNFQVFGSQKTAIQYGINRFDADTRDAMLDYYENINSIVYTDGLDEYLPKNTIEDVVATPTSSPPNIKWSNNDVVTAAHENTLQSLTDIFNRQFVTTSNTVKAIPKSNNNSQESQIERLKKMYGSHKN